MWNVGFGMGHAAREYFSHGSRRSTQKPFGVLVNNTDRAAGAADRRRSFRRWREIYMWSVENVECGVLNESRWMLNGFIMGSMGRRGCVFTVQKVIPVSKNERQWGVWNARNLIFVAKKGAPITARHDDRQGGRGKSGSSMTSSIRWRSTNQWRASTQ